MPGLEKERGNPLYLILGGPLRGRAFPCNGLIGNLVPGSVPCAGGSCPFSVQSLPLGKRQIESLAGSKLPAWPGNKGVYYEFK